MKVIHAEERDRRHRSIGRIQVVANWRSGMSGATDKDRASLVEALIREAEDYDADAIVEVRFDVDTLRSADIDATPLRRVVASALAVRYADAA